MPFGRGQEGARGACGWTRARACSPGARAVPAVVPGKPEESPIIEALRHDGAGDAAQGEAAGSRGRRLRTLGRDGRARSPRGLGRVDPGPGGDRPRGRPPVLGVSAVRRHERARRWPTHRGPPDEIDRFILAAPGGEGAASGGRRRSSRRWPVGSAFDLIGLPPSPEEVDAFVNDPAPDAYEQLVDRLLASPQFGERWGRHWLDVVRFAESLTLRGLVFKEAWRYRDYVIDAFNADVPFDRFIARADRRRPAARDASSTEEQRRATDRDHVPGPGQHEPRRAGQGPASHGRRRRAARHDRQGVPGPDDRLRPLPRPQVRPDPDPRLLRPGRHPAERQVAGARQRLEVARSARCPSSPTRKLRPEGARNGGRRARGPDQDRAQGARASAIKRGALSIAATCRASSWTTPRRARSASGQIRDRRAITSEAVTSTTDDERKGEKTLTFQPDLPAAGTYEVRLAYTPGSSRAAAVPVTVFSADGETTSSINMRSEPPIDGRFVSLGRFRFEPSGQGYVLISNEGTNGHVIADAVQFLPVDPRGTRPTRPGWPDRKRTRN